MSDCLFCKIIAGEIPSAKVFENDQVYAFRDIAPMAPTHVLVVPKKHIESLAALQAADEKFVSACLYAVQKVAAQEGLKGGFRVVSNCGDDAGQTVKHLHFHILGGERLGDRMA